MRASLATQLRAGFGLALALAVLILAAAWWIALVFRETMDVAFRTQLHNAVQLSEAESALWQLRYAIPLFMVDDAEVRRRILAEERKWQDIVERSLAAYSETARDTEARQAATSLRSAYLRYKAARPKFFELWVAGDREQAVAWRELITTPFGAATIQAFERQIARQNLVADREEARANRMERLVLLAVTAITIMLLSLLALGYKLSMRMVVPIRALREEAQRTLRDQLGDAGPASSNDNEITALVDSFRAMSAGLQARAESLRTLNERLEYLLGQTPAIIFAARASGDFGVTYISPNVRSVLGYEPGQFVREAGFYPGILHPEDRERVLGEVATLDQGGAKSSDFRVRHQDGSWRWMHVERNLKRDGSGKPVERIGFWIDVTARHRAEAATAEALRVKSEFLRNVTHELRTPLNSVIGFAELLEDQVPGPLNPKQAEFVADIVAAGKRLLLLVEAILEVSRLGDSTEPSHRVPVELGPLLGDLLARHHSAATARGVTVRLEVAPQAACATLDAEALRRIVDALLDNAIRFNREGGEVAVGARREGDMLEIAVRDTGIGIAHEDMARIFEPLVQLDAGLARGHGGIGLGLVRARGIAELHGGTLDAESEPGKGSTFTLRLPAGQ